jgi:hypothetical protein
MSDQVTLNEDLPRWLRVIQLSPDPAWQERRRAGVEALVKQSRRQDIEPLVRLVLKAKHPPTNDAVARIRQAFKAADDSFPSIGNDRELQILCGATLAELFRREGNVSSLAALAVSVATSLGVNKPELPLDLAEASEAGIRWQSELHRQRPDLNKLPAVEFPKGEFDRAVQTFQTQLDVNNVVPTVQVLIDASRASFDALLKRFSDGFRDVGRFVSIQDEELEMLWWLVGDRSIDLDRPFGKITREERPLVIAKELAQMTLYLPGPTAIKSLLVRSGLRDSEKAALRRNPGRMISRLYDRRRRGCGDCGQPAGLSKGLWASSLLSLSIGPAVPTALAPVRLVQGGPIRPSGRELIPVRGRCRMLDVAQNTVGGANPARSFGPTSDEEPKRLPSRPVSTRATSIGCNRLSMAPNLPLSRVRCTSRSSGSLRPQTIPRGSPDGRPQRESAPSRSSRRSRLECSSTASACWKGGPPRERGCLASGLLKSGLSRG